MQNVLAEETNSSAFLQIYDIYTFDEKGYFDRESIIWLTHNNKEGGMNLRFTQMFPSIEEENHQVLGNITYSFYWNWCLNMTDIKTPQEDFKKGEKIADVFGLKYGQKAHLQRTYKGYRNPDNINLALNLELIRDNPICEEENCGDYQLVYFNRIVKIKKDKIKGLKELEVKNMLPQSDIIYDEEDYKVFVWRDFSLDMGDLRMTDIKFGYGYDFPRWLFWTFIITLFGVLATWDITKYYYQKDINKNKIKDFIKNPKVIKGIGEKTSITIKKYFEE